MSSDFGSQQQDEFNNFNKHVSKTVKSVTAFAVVISIVGLGATLLIVYLIYKCIKKQGLPSINVKTTTVGGSDGAAMAEPTLPDSTIRNTTIDDFLNEIAREKPIRFTSQQLEGYTQRRSAELGRGGFGAVYKGMLPNGLDVAVKVLHEHLDGEVTEQQFMAEVRTLWRTNHANLIRLIGFCYDSAMGALVYEFMPGRSLDKYLFDRRRATVGSPADLLGIAGGIARGLRYLHEECQKKIIHHDVKASNILLDDSLTPKLTDFGIAQLLTRAATHASAQPWLGTFGYIAPEVIHVGKAPITEKCDVYSFGMLLFEVMGRRENMDNRSPDSDLTHKWLPLLAWTLYEQDKLLDLMKECSVAAADEERWKVVAERMCKVAFLCVQEMPEARPTMSMVVNMLEGHLEIPPPVYPFSWMYHQEATGSLLVLQAR